MNSNLTRFGSELRGRIASGDPFLPDFERLALELFGLQFESNAAYRRICEARQLGPDRVRQWTDIPAVPAAAFKELELTSLPPDRRTAVFHSSGTTGQTPSRHFHGAESLAVYEASLWQQFQAGLLSDPSRSGALLPARVFFLTPPPEQVPHSSLVHMFEAVRKKLAAAGVSAGGSAFWGRVDGDGAWQLDFEAAMAQLLPSGSGPVYGGQWLLGTAFSFVHLLDYLGGGQRRLQLPPGSRIMETGGYKNRSRAMPKEDLHALLTEALGVSRENIVCEYGMSELSSQAYDGPISNSEFQRTNRVFQFPSWCRARVLSPETGREVAEGETGLLRVVDLANVFSVAAIQTEDLAIRRGEGFELLGRALQAEPRGCSLNFVESLNR